jgi:hypothetical protein
VDGLELQCVTAAATLSDIHCVGLHCHADESHHITNNVFGPLKQHWSDADYTIMRKWKWLFVNGCEHKNVLSTVGDYVEE